MSWIDIPEFDSASSSQDDNPFTGNRSSQTGKVTVKVPVNEWLCKKFEKLNITLQEGYPTHNSETAGLSKDQFIKPPKTLKWYGMHSDKNDFSRSKVYTWTSEPARLNSSFPRIAGRSLPSAPASRPVTGYPEEMGAGSTGPNVHVQPGCSFQWLSYQGPGKHVKST